MKNKKDAYDTFHKLKPKATVYRKQFLYQSQREAYNKGLLNKAANVRVLIKREQTREMWHAIKTARQLTKGQSVSVVTQRVEGVIYQYKTKNEGEAAIMEMCKKRFLLMADTPIMNHIELPNLLGCLVNTKVGADILDGTFQYLEDTDEVTKDILTMLSRFATLFLGK